MPQKTKRRDEISRIPLPASLGSFPFSMGVFAGNTFYLSGHIGLDPQTKKVPTDAEQEARLVLDSFRETLARAGLRMDDLVFAQIFCSDVSLFEKFNAIYRSYFSGEFPARAFLGSGPLLFGARFEIQGIAVKPATQPEPRTKRAARKRRKR